MAAKAAGAGRPSIRIGANPSPAETSSLAGKHHLNPPIDAVTGAFSYSGRFVAQQLLERGRGVRTLTNHPRLDQPLATRIPSYPLDFSDAAAPVTGLAGPDTLCKTYRGRAPHGS